MGGLAAGSVRPAVGGPLLPAAFAGGELFRGEGFAGSLAPDVEIRPQPALPLRQRTQVPEVAAGSGSFQSWQFAVAKLEVEDQSERTDPNNVMSDQARRRRIPIASAPTTRSESELGSGIMVSSSEMA